MKQTAVEWLENKLKTYCLLTISIRNDFDKAKQMEKEQIMEAHYAPKYGCFSEQYYTSTYESKGITLQNNPQSKVITELSDEEIERISASYCLSAFNDKVFDAFIAGAKWYREQFKNR